MTETVLYERNKNGVTVKAVATKQEAVLQEATEDSAAVTKVVSDYMITATYNGEEVTREVGPGYRQTVARARKVFKEVTDKYVTPALEEAKKAEAEEKARIKQEKAEARAEKARIKAEEAAEKARLKAEKEAEKAAQLASELGEAETDPNQEA